METGNISQDKPPKEPIYIIYQYFIIPNRTMFDMNKSLEEQTEPVLRALLNLHKTKEGRQKIIDILHKHNQKNTGQTTQRRPLKRF